MARSLGSIDISNSSELTRLVDEMHESGVPRVLTRGDEEVAVLSPVVPVQDYPWREVTEEDYEAFRSAAGSWTGHLDAERFIKENYERRRISSRPPVDR